MLCRQERLTFSLVMVHITCQCIVHTNYTDVCNFFGKFSPLLEHSCDKECRFFFPLFPIIMLILVPSPNQKNTSNRIVESSHEGQSKYAGVCPFPHTCIPIADATGTEIDFTGSIVVTTVSKLHEIAPSRLRTLLRRSVSVGRQRRKK